MKRQPLSRLSKYLLCSFALISMALLLFGCNGGTGSTGRHRRHRRHRLNHRDRVGEC